MTPSHGGNPEQSAPLGRRLDHALTQIHAGDVGALVEQPGALGAGTAADVQHPTRTAVAAPCMVIHHLRCVWKSVRPRWRRPGRAGQELARR